jgi:hypothetical protein
LCYPFDTLTPIEAAALGRRVVAAWTVAALLAMQPFASTAAQRSHIARPRASTAAHPATIVIDGRVVAISPSFISRDRALVALFSSPPPGRSLASVLPRFGAKASFEPASGTVIIVKGRTTMTMSLGNLHVDIDGKRRTLDSAPLIYQGRVTVPIRVVAEALNSYVEWFGPHRLVLVTQHNAKPAEPDESPFLRWLRAALKAVWSYLALLFGGLWRGALGLLVLGSIVGAGRWLYRRYIGRAQLQVVPFVAPDHKGITEHSVSIVAALTEQIESQRRASQSLARSSGYLGTAKGPVLIYPELGTIGAISKALSVLDKGNVVTQLVELITRPEYRISGSVSAAGTDADVGVRVDRYGTHYWAGTARRAQADLAEAAKDLGYLALRAIADRQKEDAPS